MQNKSSARICILPKLSGVGGMVSFQHKFSQGLEKRGIQVCYDLQDEPYQAVLVIGGTRKLSGLWRAGRKGIPIVQRLDGMNWMHRLPTHPTNKNNLIGDLRHYLRAEYGNFILSLLRSRIANVIVYQSEFVRRWWQDTYGIARAKSQVVYNGVNLNAYSPEGVASLPAESWRLLMVEGSLMGGYEQGLQAAVGVAQKLATCSGVNQRTIELMVVGKVSPEVQNYWNRYLAEGQASNQMRLVWAGLVNRDEIPQIDRSAHLLYSSDINAACPNSVIEALACGLPVIAFDTGALPELVTGDAGRIVPYGGNPWRLEPPHVQGLAEAAQEILINQDRFRKAARQRAEQAFDLEHMVDQYLDILLG